MRSQSDALLLKAALVMVNECFFAGGSWNFLHSLRRLVSHVSGFCPGFGLGFGIGFGLGFDLGLGLGFELRTFVGSTCIHVHPHILILEKSSQLFSPFF